MVVAQHGQYAAVGRGAIGVAMLERVAGAIDAGALAVPDGEDAIDGALIIRFDLLTAEHGGAAELFIDGRLEGDAGRVEMLLRLAQRDVVAAQR